MSVFNYKIDDLFKPTLKALNDLDKPASTHEIEEKITEILELSDYEKNEKHCGHKRTRFRYTASWARSIFKKCGFWTILTVYGV